VRSGYAKGRLVPAWAFTSSSPLSFAYSKQSLNNSLCCFLFFVCVCCIAFVLSCLGGAVLPCFMALVGHVLCVGWHWWAMCCVWDVCRMGKTVYSIDCVVVMLYYWLLLVYLNIILTVIIWFAMVWSSIFVGLLITKLNTLHT
jgi:hypothetical protein